jgi:hypothetical protein
MPEPPRRLGCGRSGLLVWGDERREGQSPAGSPCGWVGRTHCWVRPPEEPDLRLAPHPARAGPSDPVTRGRTICSRKETRSSAAPLAATVAAASSLSVGSGVVVTFVFEVHLTTSARFRSPGTGPGIRPVIHNHQQEGAEHSGRGFPPRFGRRHWLLGHPVPARELSSPHGRPTDPSGPDPDGVSAFRTHELRSGWVPSLLRDSGARPDRSRSPASARRITTACPCTPPQPSIHAGLWLTEHQPRVHASSPVRTSPRPWLPGWNESPSALRRASHPAITRGARRGGDRSLSTDLNQRPMSST